ncbi:hypothetical protein ACIPVK_12050 [Paeniglutamicibacter sp. MACA_103]
MEESSKGSGIRQNIQQRHGQRTRRPGDLSREAFVDEAIAVIQQCTPGQR